MRYNGEEKTYFKVVLIRVHTGDYCIIKGPEEEKRLAEILQNDYNSTKYEKMIQLLGAEVVQREHQKEFRSRFSAESVLKEFEKGKSVIEYSYMRIIDGVQRAVSARIYPRTGQGEKTEEFMVYVTIERQTETEMRNADVGTGA